MATDAPSAVGVPVPRVDADEKVAGTALYAADVRLPGVLRAQTLRSPHPHARIVRTDTSKARALPGVHAVLTGDDFPPDTRWGRRIVDVPVLAQGVVRFVGDPVAAVAADDQETAQRAIALIEVDYEELPAVFDAEEAMQPGALLVHPDLQRFEGLPNEIEQPTNVVVRWEWGQGDVEEGFKDADLVVERTYTTPSQHHVYLEPHTCLSWGAEDGKMHVWAPSKAPYSNRNRVAALMDLDPEDVIFHPVVIGGDFGGKASPMSIPVTCFLAKATGRPVLMVFDYAEELMAGNPRHESKIRIRTGVKRDGTLVAHDVQIIFNSGAYAGFKPLGHLSGCKSAGGPYRISHTRVVEHMVYTHNVPCGHMRGPGEPQAIFALESHMDEVARAIGMDPVDLRLKNFVGDGEANAIGEVLAENRVAETLRAAIEAAGYGEPEPANVGRGVAVGERAAGTGTSTAVVSLEPDGSVVVTTPFFEQGAGAYTVLQQVAAESMGLPAERVQLRVAETGLVDSDAGIGGSRATNLGSGAAAGAVREAQQEVCRLAAELEGWPENALTVRGDLLVRTDTGESRPWKTFLARTGRAAVGRFTFTAARGGAHVTAYCAQVAEVSVDPETGRVKLLKLTTAHDVGRIINPTGHQGQIYGGAVMGVGFGLMEELAREDGRISTLSLADYKIPTIVDVPDIETVLLEPGEGIGPFGIKAIGETPNVPTAAAIANAVMDAVGVRIQDLPVSGEKVYRALREREAAARRPS